ncbi:dynein regulatory complex subunit 2 isoform X1 [Kryptolebias marmoratus]|uniref:Dynein regulatory complex subunit 2 n=2 Tax=Kryptolebias marmoratus TaxID=37003 RepID=A0A3Q3A266_KRYMA|nr:dynein regulatory complex subunit 2 isoform X1 [Kryptolebias marmoratus]
MTSSDLIWTFSCPTVDLTAGRVLELSSGNMPRKTTKGGEMSEEERLLQLQHRAQAEEEVARRKQETLTLYLQDKLQKEQRNTAVNLLKLNDSWRKILRQARDAELRKDLMVLQQTFERQLDELNFIIQRLVCDLQEAELQMVQVQQSHLQHVDFLWTQQDKRLKSVQQQWDSVLQDISSMSRSEKDRMLSGFEQQRTELNDEQLFAEGHGEDTLDDVENLYGETLALLQGVQEDMSVMKTDVKLRDRTPENLRALQLRRNRAKTLDEQISRNKQQMTTELRKITRLKDRATWLRQQLSSRKAEKVLIYQDQSATADRTNQKCHQLREQLAQDRRAARKKLTELSDRSGAVAKKLQAVISKGERVLHVAEMCRKLQNKQEVLTGQFEELQQHLNLALLRREHLRNHQTALSQENQQLELLLQQHSDVLHGPHAPLLVSPAPSTSVPAAADRCHNIIEAAHAVKHCL